MMRLDARRSALVATTTMMMLALTIGAAHARGGAPRKGWVPQEAWNAVKARAATDLGRQVKVYKSGWSKSLSRGLQSTLGAPGEAAYVVHAKARGKVFSYAKSKGPYLAVKSGQGNWEVFPLATAADSQGRPDRGNHITRASAGVPDNNTYAFADGALGGTKVVQAVKASGTVWTSTREGQIVAQGGKGRSKTLFILGDPNRQGSDPAAYAEVKLHGFSLPPSTPRPPMPPVRPLGEPTAGASSERTIVPPGFAGSTLRTKFIDVPQPLHQAR